VTEEKMNNKFPNREEAEQILEEGIAYRLKRPYPFLLENEYRFHVHGVAEAAFKIALKINELDAEKAYVLGLLHDFGKRISEKAEKKFHGLEGYEAMMKYGYPEIAKICLTHTFPDKDFKDEEYSYPQKWKDELHKLLATVEYDDYDRLICLCDKFFEGMSMVSLEKRANGIAKRYNLTAEQKEALLSDSYRLKDYFESKTDEDIYSILGIK